MSGPIFILPLDQLRKIVGDTIEACKTQGSIHMLHAAVSISEYLKDAERWAHVRDYEIPAGMSAKETTAYVDQQLKEVNDDVERVIRARQRREDGVPGSSGTGNTTNPIV